MTLFWLCPKVFRFLRFRERPARRHYFCIVYLLCSQVTRRYWKHGLIVIICTHSTTLSNEILIWMGFSYVSNQKNVVYLLITTQMHCYVPSPSATAQEIMNQACFGPPTHYSPTAHPPSEGIARNLIPDAHILGLFVWQSHRKQASCSSSFEVCAIVPLLPLQLQDSCMHSEPVIVIVEDAICTQYQLFTSTAKGINHWGLDHWQRTFSSTNPDNCISTVKPSADSSNQCKNEKLSRRSSRLSWARSSKGLVGGALTRFLQNTRRISSWRW